MKLKWENHKDLGFIVYSEIARSYPDTESCESSFLQKETKITYMLFIASLVLLIFHNIIYGLTRNEEVLLFSLSSLLNADRKESCIISSASNLSFTILKAVLYIAL